MRKDFLKSFLIITLLFLSAYAVATNAKYYIINGDITEVEGIAEPNLGAPSGDVRYERNIDPEIDSTYNIGKQTRAWQQVYADEFCLTADTCVDVWGSGGGGGGSGFWSTSTDDLLIRTVPTSLYVVMGGSATTSPWTDERLQVIGNILSDGLKTDEATTTGFTINGERFTSLTGTGLSNVAGVLTSSGGGGWEFATTTLDYWWDNTTGITPSAQITAGNFISWTGATLNVADNWWNDLSDLPLAENLVYRGDASNNPEATNDLVILSDGSVGIGSTSPAFKLSVDGSLYSNDYRNIQDEDIGLLYNVEGALYKTLEDYYNATQSGGWFEGFDFTDNGDGSFDVGPGSGIIKTTNSPVGQNVIGSVLSTTTLWAVDDETVYVYADYNGGDVIFATSSSNIANGHTLINIGKVFREGTDVHFFRAGQVISDIPKRVIQRFNADGEVQLTNGGVVAETGTRYLTVTEAVLWGGLERFVASAIDTSGADTFEYYYTDGVGGWQYLSSTASQINNTQYDNGGALTVLTNNRYRTDFVYLTNDGDLLVMLGTNNSANLVDAQNILPPSSTPAHISEFSTVIAKIIVQEGQTNLTEVDNIQGTTVFDSSGSIVHNETTGKQGGTTDEYYHLTSTEYTVVGNTSGTNTGDVTLVGTPNYLTLSGQEITMTVLDISDDTNLAVSTGITLTDDTLTSNDSEIVHDNLSGFVANEHIDWTGASAGIIHATNYVDNNTTYTGGTNLTLDGTTFNVDDAFILNTGDTLTTGSYNFGGADSLEMPNSTSPSVITTGVCALDITSDQFLVADSSGIARPLLLQANLFGVTVASTSEEFVSGGALPIGKNIFVGRSIKQFRCYVDGGTSIVMNVSDGTNDTETITCATTVTSDTDVTTNNTFTAGEKWELQFGTITGTPDYLIFEATGYITRD